MTANQFNTYMELKLIEYFASVKSREASYQNVSELADWFDDFLTWMEENSQD